MTKKAKNMYKKIIGISFLIIGWILLAYILSNTRLDIKVGLISLFGLIAVDFLLFLAGISFISSISIKEIFRHL